MHCSKEFECNAKLHILFRLASTCFPAMLMRKMSLKDQQRNMSLYQRIRFGCKVIKFRSHSPVHRAVLINSDRGGNQDERKIKN